MPNTLAHIGVQTLLSKSIFRKCDFKWIAIGCIIPDIPWMFQRLIPIFLPEIDRITLRAYCITQASFFFCLFICCSLSLFTRSKKKIFILLSGNCFFHLLLDSLQIKWANGVHFSAPFSWHLTSFNLFWPEHPLSLALTITGCAVFLYAAPKDIFKPLDFSLTPAISSLISFFLITLYLLLPIAFMSGPYQKDNHYIQTLDNEQARHNKKIALDRVPYLASSKSIILFTGEKIHVTNKVPDQDGIISVKGIFKDQKTISTTQYHYHSSSRDLYSIIGLIAVFSLWLVAIFQKAGKVLLKK